MVSDITNEPPASVGPSQLQILSRSQRAPDFGIINNDVLPDSPPQSIEPSDGQSYSMRPSRQGARHKDLVYCHDEHGHPL